MIKDPRIEGNNRHLLIDIILIAIGAVICGAKEWEEIENYGEEKRAWFVKFLALPNEIPAYDTFARVFSRLDLKTFQEGFINWFKELVELLPEEVIAIDRKTL